MGLLEMEVEDDGNTATKESTRQDHGQNGQVERKFTEEDLLISSPLVLGFSLSDKLWLEFTVNGIKDIQWNESAFDSLVLPKGQKLIVKALVQSHTSGVVAIASHTCIVIRIYHLETPVPSVVQPMQTTF